MKISARNMLKGTVESIVEGMVMAKVSLTVGANTITSLISKESVSELKLKKGSTAYSLIKSTEVMIAKDSKDISARNCLKGIIKSITLGTVMAKVVLNVEENEITALISQESVSELGLKENETAYAIIKSTEVMIAVE
jgi:molybdate transport system regulatory protein